MALPVCWWLMYNWMWIFLFAFGQPLLWIYLYLWQMCESLMYPTSHTIMFSKPHSLMYCFSPPLLMLLLFSQPLPNVTLLCMPGFDSYAWFWLAPNLWLVRCSLWELLCLCYAIRSVTRLWGHVRVVVLLDPPWLRQSWHVDETYGYPAVDPHAGSVQGLNCKVVWKKLWQHWQSNTAEYSVSHCVSGRIMGCE